MRCKCSWSCIQHLYHRTVNMERTWMMCNHLLHQDMWYILSLGVWRSRILVQNEACLFSAFSANLCKEGALCSSCLPGYYLVLSTFLNTLWRNFPLWTVIKQWDIDSDVCIICFLLAVRKAFYVWWFTMIGGKVGSDRGKETQMVRGSRGRLPAFSV